jgi:cell fate regulator YaaT (PSP1 superfamily)
VNDRVIIQAERGEDFGVITHKIEKKIDFDRGSRPRSILRPASEEDMTQNGEIRAQEPELKREIAKMVREHRLKMKVADVERQFDGVKMTVYFTADHRVDFRELVKNLASRYRTRIELRQIGVRDEARRMGGYGICGLKLCCTSHIDSFSPVSTQHARDQDLPLNPSKISGNCCRLLCCLKFEAGQYAQTRKLFPSPGRTVRTKMGEGRVERIDYFQEEAIVRIDDLDTIRVRAEDILNDNDQDAKTTENETVEADTNSVNASADLSGDEADNETRPEDVN